MSLDVKSSRLASITVLALLSFIVTSAKAEEDDAALKSWFQAMSQHGNVECSVQFGETDWHHVV